MVLVQNLQNQYIFNLFGSLVRRVRRPRPSKQGRQGRRQWRQVVNGYMGQSKDRRTETFTVTEQWTPQFRRIEGLKCEMWNTRSGAVKSEKIENVKNAKEMCKNDENTK